MSISLRQANKDNPIEHLLAIPETIDTSISDLFMLDLDSREDWNTASIRESLWDFVEDIKKYLVSSNPTIIALTPAGFFVAKLLFPQIDNSSQEINVPQDIDLEKIKSNLLLSGKFVSYLIKKGALTAEVVFHPSFVLPLDIIISTPLTFPENNQGLLLTFDKNGWWNPLGGHIEKDETWQATLQREAQEEGGVEIDDIKVFGYVKVDNLTGQETSEFPPISQIPLTISHITSYQEEWVPMETSSRQFFNPQEAYESLKVRTDNGQMLQIYSYLLFLKNKNIL